LPTSLTYIILETRGCLPWRSDAVIGTTRPEAVRSPRFSRAVRGAPDTPEPRVLYRRSDPISGQSVSRATASVKEKRELFLGPLPASLGPLASPPWPGLWLRDLNLIPFRGSGLPTGGAPLSGGFHLPLRVG